MKKIILLLFLLSLPAIWVLIVPGGYEPHDFHHVADIYEMSRAISTGQVMPRLGPDFMFGFGYPLFNYYYVLPFYLGAAFFFLTGYLMTALKMVFLTSALVSVVGMYMLLKKYYSSLVSFAGAVLYLYTPFRAVEIYVRGAIGEAVAIALLPWVFLVLTNLVEKKTYKNIAMASLVLALFFLTHNYFFLLAFPFIVLYLIVLIVKQKEWVKNILYLGSSAILAAAASAFWWLPAFSEYKLVAAATPFVIEDHFPFIKQLILPSWGYGSSVWGPNDEISFQIGLVNLAIVAIALLLLLRLRRIKDKKYKLALWAFVSFGVCVFMMNIRSLPLWHLVPFTNFIQFPWRLLSFTTFFTTFLVGFVLENINFKKAGAIAVIVFSIVLTFLYFRPSARIDKTNAQYVAHFFNNPLYSEDYLQLPVESSERPNFVAGQKFVGGEGANIDSINQTSDISWEAEVSAETDTTVMAYALNFPGWKVEVDGQEVQTSSGKPYGQIIFPVSEGVHQVRLYWSETPLRAWADVMSLIAVIIILVLYIKPEMVKLK